MRRPYVICHILSSLDGKISGPFMGMESVSMLGAEYGKFRTKLDADGEIGWESGVFSNKGRTPAHVIEVLTESTPAAYKDYLRKRSVSYIIAGEKNLDYRLAMEKLYECFHIKKC